MRPFVIPPLPKGSQTWMAPEELSLIFIFMVIMHLFWFVIFWNTTFINFKRRSDGSKQGVFSVDKFNGTDSKKNVYTMTNNQVKIHLNYDYNYFLI